MMDEFGSWDVLEFGAWDFGGAHAQLENDDLYPSVPKRLLSLRANGKKKSNKALSQHQLQELLNKPVDLRGSEQLIDKAGQIACEPVGKVLAGQIARAVDEVKPTNTQATSGGRRRAKAAAPIQSAPSKTEAGPVSPGDALLRSAEPAATGAATAAAVATDPHSRAKKKHKKNPDAAAPDVAGAMATAEGPAEHPTSAAAVSDRRPEQQTRKLQQKQQPQQPQQRISEALIQRKDLQQRQQPPAMVGPPGPLDEALTKGRKKARCEGPLAPAAAPPADGTRGEAEQPPARGASKQPRARESEEQPPAARRRGTKHGAEQVPDARGLKQPQQQPQQPPPQQQQLQQPQQQQQQQLQPQQARGKSGKRRAQEPDGVEAEQRQEVDGGAGNAGTGADNRKLQKQQRQVQEQQHQQHRQPCQVGKPSKQEQQQQQQQQGGKGAKAGGAKGAGEGCTTIAGAGVDGGGTAPMPQRPVAAANLAAALAGRAAVVTAADDPRTAAPKAVAIMQAAAGASAAPVQKLSHAAALAALQQRAAAAAATATVAPADDVREAAADVTAGTTAARRTRPGPAAGGGRKPAAPSGFLDKMRAKLAGGRFRFLNEELYTRSGEAAYLMMQNQTELFSQYHDGFKRQTRGWPKQPVDVAIGWLRAKRSEIKEVADFGCGDAKIAASVPQSVHSFDLVAAAPGVIACNMSSVPLPDGSVDAAVFSLALMGTDYGSFLEEAVRVLKPKGWLWIAEVRSRFSRAGAGEADDGGGSGEDDDGARAGASGGAGGGEEDFQPFLSCLKRLGLKLVSEDAGNKMFVVWVLRKADGGGGGGGEGKAGKRAGRRGGGGAIPWPALKACVYKKR